MNQAKRWSNDTLGAAAVAALVKNRFTASYCENRAQAVATIISRIDEQATIGIGGSVTLTELGIIEQLKQSGHTVFNHNQPGLTADEIMVLRQAQQSCDVFLCSTNALTLDGQLVNVDGVGNRLSAMIFGPKQVVIVVGINKIVGTIGEAQQRIERLAAPMNNKRLERPNPCTVSGVCMNCQGPTRICNVTTIIHKQPPLTPIHVVIIGEELGY